MLTFERLTPSAAPLHLRALAHHLEAVRAERLPNDPPLDIGATVAGLQRPDLSSDRQYLLLWQDAHVVARATVTLPRLQRLDQAEFELTVLAPHRQRGLARRLLKEVVGLAEQSGRRTLMTTASSRLPSGEAVLRHLGARLVQQQQFMELDLHSLEPQRLMDRVRDAAEAAPDYLVWSHLGAYPQDRLAAIAQVYDVMKTAPQGAKDSVETGLSVQDLQRQDEQLRMDGRQRLTTFAEHRPSGEVVAFTELFWNLQRPTVMIQHGTAVQLTHRRHSLGQWIKVANLLAVRHFNPGARFVRAGNTDDNTGMLRINHALGFRSYLIHTDWRLEVEELRAALDRYRS